jgi:hypothetical protein
MRQVQAVILGLVLGSMGCSFFGPSDRTDSIPAVAALAPEKNSGEIVCLDVALIDQPYGAPFINNEVWELGDEQGVDLEMKPVLEENGLRICQLGGVLPVPLQSLLTSPRSCSGARRITAEPGKPKPLPVGERRERCAFHLAGAAGRRLVSLEQAQCELEVTPTLEDDKRIHLRFTPQIRHGPARIKPRVEKDPDGPLRWSMEAKEEIESFPELHWDCTIGPNELIVLGTQPNRPDTLGGRFFLPDGDPPRQWLVVLRASRLLIGMPLDETLTRTPPLAMQAAWTAARGSAK